MRLVQPEDAAPAYAELICRSAFSFLEGASKPEELVDRAVELGLSSLAITDRDGVQGVVRAHGRIRELVRTGRIEEGSFHLIVGSLLRVEGLGELVLLAEDRHGYGNLCALVTRGRRRVPKGECLLRPGDLGDFAGGLVALLLDTDPPGTVEQLKEVYGDRLFLALRRHLLPGREERLRRMVEVGRRLGVPPVAVTDALIHHPDRQALQDVLTCIRLGCTVQEAGLRLQPNAERHLQSPERMTRLFADLPEAVHRTLEVAERCTFSLDQLRYRYPSELLPEGTEAMAHLRALVEQGARERYPKGLSSKVRGQVEHELALIARLDFPHYFLTVHDLVRFARGRGILCQGRGSAANSAVCFLLGITAVDPSRSSLLFERFISEERGEPPDIDVDFEHERREEVIQYLYDKYGRDRAAMATEVITYRSRSAVREVGKALGFEPEEVDRVAKLVSLRGGRFAGETPLRGEFRAETPCYGQHGGVVPEAFQEAGLDPKSPRVRLFGALSRQIYGMPRHLGIHVGGFVLSDEPIDRIVPIENATMEGRTVIQWDKDDLDTLGLLKVDVLALGMLTCIRKSTDLLRAHGLADLDLASIPPEDPAVYDMICEADTVGVFQIESRAQMGMLPRLKPRCFYDLVVEVAIIRPGPIQGKMVHPYLRRRQGIEPVDYPHPALEEILGRTYGVPLFQEQVMSLAVAVAGFTPGEADELRRAMGSWRRTGHMHELGHKLVSGMKENGLPEEFAGRILEQIRGFAEYGFPESHAASFALLVYASAWLKRHHPEVFTCALINSLPMGFYPMRTLIADAQRHEVPVRGPDLQRSDWDCTLEPYRDAQGRERRALRLGLRVVKGLGAAPGRAVCEARDRGGPFRSLSDLLGRTGLHRKPLEALAQANTMLDLGLPRRRALWLIRALPRDAADLWRREEPPDADAPLPEPTLTEDVIADYRAMGFSVGTHPIELLRPSLDKQGVLRTAELRDTPHGRIVSVAGVVVARQRPATASGVIFLSLEDESGMANVVIWPRTYERIRHTSSGPVIRVTGRLEREGLVANLIAHDMEALTLDRRDEISAPARSFH